MSRRPLGERAYRWLLVLAALAACAPAFGGGEGEGMAEHAERRRAQLERWRELEGSAESGLDRFATTVQYVVDLHAAAGGDARGVLDDLVDLFVGAEFRLEKGLAMTTPSLLGGDAIDEGPGDLSGFAPHLQEGEGRFRHFALNAAASYVAPDALVDFLARLRGNDLAPDTPDSLADVEANRIGQEFSGLLRSRPLSELAGGGAVREWLLERFGPG